MNVLEAVRLALAQLRAQKLKSFFTLLGVTIGTMFLIAVVSVVEGMGKYVEQDFAGKFLGVNTFNVRRFPDIQTGEVTEAMWREWQRRPFIYEADAYAIRDALPAGTRWAIDAARWATPVSRYATAPQAIAHAVTSEYFAIKDLKLDKGRTFTPQEEVTGAPVAVIGRETAETLFPNLDPIGREMKIRGFPYQVIGVLEKQGSVFGLSLDRQVIAPWTSPLRRVVTPRGNIYGVVVQAKEQRALDDTKELVRETMRARRHLRPGEDDNFVFETSETALSQWLTIKKYLVLAGIVLPAIGLVVGAIVIMNIMLVAVAERTREIGIRKSLGARRRDILSQFLVESATLSVIGAALGIGLGFALAKLIAIASPLPTNVAPWSIVVSVVLGGGVGIAAGIYPASRAARLDPIVALRAE